MDDVDVCLFFSAFKYKGEECFMVRDVSLVRTLNFMFVLVDKKKNT